MYVYISAIKMLFIRHLIGEPSQHLGKEVPRGIALSPESKPRLPKVYREAKALGNSGRGFPYNSNLPPLFSTTSLPAAEQQPQQPLHNVRSRLRYMQPQRVSLITQGSGLGASRTELTPS